MNVNLTFDHDKEDFIESIGFQPRSFQVAKMTVKYEFIFPMVMASILDDKENFKSRTKSQILESSLKRVKGNPEVEALILLIFQNTYSSIKKDMLEFNDKLSTFIDEDGEIDVKRGRIEAESIEDALSQLTLLMKIKPLMALLEIMKETNCNYDAVIAFTVDDVSMEDAINGKLTPDENSEKSPKNYDDIDDIINRALGGSDDE